MSDYGSAHDDEGLNWGPSAARSTADPAQQAQVQTFCSVTGADADTAEHVLEAHGWDLNRSVEFFLENGAAHPSTQAVPTAPPLFQAAQAPIVVDDDSPPPLVPARDAAAVETAGASSAPAADHEVYDLDQDDRDLQQALQASMRSDETAQARQHQDPAQLDDEDDQDAALARMLASHDENMRHQSRPLEDASGDQFAGMPQGFLGNRGILNAHRQQAGQAASSRGAQQAALEAIGRSMGIGLPSALPPAFPGMPAGPSNQSSSAMQDHAEEGNGAFAHQASGIDMPSDINVEEARMLEAAMLGIPYEGRITDFAAQPSRPYVPPSSESLAGRNVRQEQDWAYEQSLQADRDKHEAAERVAREQREAEEAAARQVADAEAAARAKEARLKQTLQHKQQALPAEPDTGEADTVQVAVRMPNGSRFTRRFRFTDKLSHLFAAIDVHTQGQELPPGSYRLVAQYPRRVFTEGLEGSLRDVGLAQSKQEAVLVETID